MASTFSNLKIELIGTGDQSGTWGTTTNTNLGTAIEEAITGRATANFATDADLTLGYTDTNAAQVFRNLILNVTSGVSLTATRNLIVPTIEKQYLIENNTTGAQDIVVKTVSGTGITVPNGRKAHLYANGTDVVWAFDQVDINGGTIDNVVVGGVTPAAGAFTTVDTTNIEVTNIKAKDGTAAASIADSTGVVSITANPILSGGTANGVGYLNASKVLTTGTALTFDGTNLVNLGGVVRALAAATQDALQLQGRAGGTSSYITTLTPGTLTASNTLTLPVGTTTLAGLGTTQTFSAAQTFSSTVTMSGTTTNIALGTSQTSGTWTAGGAAQTGTITLDQSTKTHTLAIGTGATESGLTKTINIGTGGVATSTTAITIGSTNGTTITLNGTVNATTVNLTTLDLTNLEVTNIKAKDGTAAASIADATGVITVSQAPVMSALTASQAVFTDGSKGLVSNAITGTGNVVMSGSPTLTGTVAGASLQLSSLTSGRVTYAGASGLLQDSANLTFNGTDLTVSGAVNAGTVNATTFDMTNLEVTNIKAKDGTAAASIADSTGIITVTTQLNVDNLNLSGNTLSSTDANGNIVLAPNGTGDVQLDADTVRIGDSNANATLTTNGTGDLILNTNSGTNSGSITIADGANGDMTLTPNGNGSVVITNTGTSNALRITQTGTGNALLVEDSTNPDSTPFVIDASGIVIKGYTSNVSTIDAISVHSAGTSSQLGFSGYNWNASGVARFAQYRSTSGTVGTNGAVVNGSEIGRYQFFGDDGAAFIEAARITGAVDGTPGTNDMPGRLVFSTTADGATVPTERVRINASGLTTVGFSAATGAALSTTVAAKLYSANTTYTDGITAASGTVTHGTIVSFDNPAIAASNASVTYTNASTLYIDGAPSAGSNVTITNPYALYVAAGTVYFGGTVSAADPIVQQSDIGTGANEIPLNQYLGANAYVDTEKPALAVGTGITTGTGTICKANGGIQGGVFEVTIIVDLTGLNSGGTAGDIIGVNGTALPCYIAQLPAMTVLGGRMTCLETPAGGDTDIDLYSATEGTGVEDQAITALTETQIINAGTQSIGTVTYFAADPATNAYFYLVGQSTSNATYTAGRFLIEIFGVQ